MTKTKKAASFVPLERIAGSIYLIRGQKVMLDRDLADLYGVSTGSLNQAVNRNIERFPEGFMFQLTKEEMENWKSQIVISNPSVKMSLRKPPLAFTEHGVAMLSSVLRSKHAIQINITIIKTFIRMRELLATNDELARKVALHDRDIATLFAHVKRLLTPPDGKGKPPIGFIPLEEKE